MLLSAPDQRAAVSHTAAAAAPLITRQAPFEQAGIIATTSFGELLDAAVLMSSQPVPAGSAVAIVSNGGGAGALAADACADVGLAVELRPVVHTSHPSWGYLLRLPAASVVLAPEFWQFPAWAAGADLMFADAAGWNRPIRFAHGAGGHMAALDVAGQARQHRVRRLVFAHIGRPSLRAIDAGYRLPFGEWGVPGRTYRIPVLPAQAPPSRSRF